jgi:hypothetical protein
MSTTPRFGLGALVKHRDFGRGRVVAYDDRYVMRFRGGDAKLVAFAFDGARCHRRMAAVEHAVRPSRGSRPKKS